MFTPAEEKRVVDYDRETAEQIQREKEYAERPLKKGSMVPLLDALGAEALESIKEANFEIGVFLKCKETFKTQDTKDMANYFINLARYKIEGNRDDISRWRSYKKESR